MAINKNPTPSIPNIPAGLDATTALFLGAVKETIEVREGRRGTGEHRFLPSKEIIDLINIVSTEIRYDKVVAASKDPIHPPTNFSVRAGHWCNYLTWENPSDDALYAATEVWCNTTNSRSEASLIAVVTYPHAAYTHYIDNYTADHYYWIRGRSFSPGVYSTWVPTDAMGGVLVEGSETVGETISALMSLLEGQITEGQLYPLLNERLDKIPVLESAIADIQQVPMFDAERDWSLESLVRYEGKLYRAIQDMTAPSPDPTNTSYWALVGEYASLGEAAAVHAVILNDHETRIDVTEAGISANASDIVTLGTTVSDNTALIQTNASSIDGIMAKYTVKIDNNGVVAGYGLISEPNDGEIVSEFGVLADSFFVAKPGYANRIPFIIGTVDGIDTVAINGNLVVDGTILGRSIAADQITAGHIQGNAINGNHINANSQITIGNNESGSASDYIVLDGVEGTIKTYKWFAGAHRQYKQLLRRESGIANHGTVVQIPGYFSSVPDIQVSINTLYSYLSEYGLQDQQWSCWPDEITEFSPGRWQFKPVVGLYLAGASGSQILADYQESSSDTHTSNVFQTPPNTSAITMTVRLKSVRGTGTVPNYYYRQVKWRIGRSANGTDWAWTTYQTKNIGATFDYVQDSRTLSLPSAQAWYIKIEYIAEDAGGTFASGSVSYDYDTEVKSTDAEVELINYSVDYETISLNTGEYSPPPGWTIWKVSWTAEVRYGSYGWAGDSEYRGRVYNTRPPYTSDGTWYFSGPEPSWVSQVVSREDETVEYHPNIMGRVVGAGAGIRNASQTIYIRKPKDNSTTPSNGYNTYSYRFTLAAATPLASGVLNWIAIGE